MKLTICPVTLCRTPVFSSQAQIEEVWEDLKTYIEESSPAFFEIIKEIEANQLNLLDAKARFTLWKYFNRAKFRATPYGKFAAFSLVPVSKEESYKGIKVAKEAAIHRFADWSEKENVNLDPSWLLKNAHYLRSNTTAYLCGDELRYVNVIEGIFELSAINNQELAATVIRFCHIARTIKEVKDLLHTEGMGKATANYFIEQLISLQLLFTDMHPNIIGQEYFRRIGFNTQAKANDYIIAERKLAEGYLNEKSLQILLETVHFLSKHLPAKNNRSLTDFRDQFRSKFENKEIPLLTALDPEVGINYISLEQDKDEDSLIQGLKKFRDSTHTGADHIRSALQRYIIDQMMSGKTVQLAGFKGEEPAPQNIVANTFSVLMQHADDLIVAKQIGGVTANALLGRFSMVSHDIEKLGNSFAEVEEKANPDVLFFDIAYQAEKHVDNVNRRKSLYGYELPLLTWTESRNIIDPDDIMVSVMNGELVLRSLKYGKRIIPKLASAYNYTRSDLTIFRFLSDLQHQHIHSALTVSIDHILPGLSHYPRIQYKKVVLSPAKWLVPEVLCLPQKDLPLSAVTDWLQTIGMKQPFKCGSADQTLCFNPLINDDMTSFLAYCRNKTSLYIEEAFIPEQPLITDEEGSPYLSEFIVSITHEEEVYTSYFSEINPEEPLSSAGKPVADVFLPGSEWLYYEIYCHPSRSNAILQNNLKNCINAVKKDIKGWFFIRYTIPSHHIRFRLQLKQHTDGYEMMRTVAKFMEPNLLSGIISDLQIKTYRRENERYGSGRIDSVEKCFHADSEFVLHLLKSDYQVLQLYALSIYLIEKVWEAIGFSLQECMSAAEKVADSFAREMNIQPEGFKMINQRFKDFTNRNDIAFLKTQQKEKLDNSAAAFIKVLNTCNLSVKPRLLTDLFHMHVNRLFRTDQRMHELVIYHFLARMIKIKIGRLKNAEIVQAK